jgi:hypothetical protein
MSSKDVKHDRDLYRCYKLGQVLYIPSYNDEGIFVGPGGRKRIEADLIKLGALPVNEMLYVTSARDGKRG